MNLEYSPSDLQSEWLYIFEERLAILAGPNKPTPQQLSLALSEADAHIKALLK